MDNLVGPLTIKIGGEANGEDREDVEDVVVMVVVAKVETVVEVEEEAGVVLDHTVPLRATAAGCVAIWSATVPSLLSHKEVAWLALPEESLLNPGTKAQEVEEEVGQLDSGVSTYYTTRPGMSTQWTMQVNCTSPSDMNSLRPTR